MAACERAPLALLPRLPTPLPVPLSTAAFPCTPQNLEDCPKPPGAISSTDQIPQFITSACMAEQAWALHIAARCMRTAVPHQSGSSVPLTAAATLPALCWLLQGHHLQSWSSALPTAAAAPPALPLCAVTWDDAVNPFSFGLVQQIVGGFKQRSGCGVPSTLFISTTSA